MNNLNIGSEIEKSNLRYNILTFLVYIVGIVLIAQLFNLQIVNGEEYRVTSNTRLTREAKIEAARGSILDRSGNILASTDMGFSLEMYKTKVSDDVLNNSISLMTKILEQNGDTYIDLFPISTDPYEFQFSSDEELASWKKKYKIPEEASPEEAMYIVKDKYNIKSEDPAEIRRILAVRYAITTKGYSTTKSIEISSNISRQSAVLLQENSNELTGVNVVIEPIRKYYMGNLASHIIGYMGRISDENKEEIQNNGDEYEYENDDKIGQAGIEKTFEEYLRGTDGIKQIDMDVEGSITGEYVSKEAIGGTDIVLSIDANLQAVAERALVQNIEKIRTGGFSQAFNTKGGSVVVTNVNTGEILAMASYPDYDPAVFYNGITSEQLNIYNDLGVWTNRSTQSAYAPGSTFKMVTAIAALETGTTNTTERINDNGPYPAAHNPACWYYNQYGRGHGPLNVTGAIEKSCNYFFYEMGNRMGIDTLSKYAKYFGLGMKTGIELIRENSGVVAQKSITESKGEAWTVGDTLVASIGQGYNNFTPVQMAKYISMVANGGNKIDLSIVKNIVNPDGSQLEKAEIREFLNKKLGNLEQEETDIQGISEDTMKAVKEGMRSVTSDEGGTAYSIFKNFPIEVGGKTGSAETSSRAGADVNAWFVGFAPFDNPDIAVVVVVENGGDGSYTAEVVRDIISEYFGMNVKQINEDMSAISEMEKIR